MESFIPPDLRDFKKVKAAPMPTDNGITIGYDFNNGIDYHKILATYRSSGFQASNFGKAVEEIKKMLAKKKEPLSEENQKKVNMNPIERNRSNCTIFLGMTSNMISSGNRETVRFLVQHNLVDCIVITAGGIEEDIMKCREPTYLGEFHYRGSDLRPKRHCRIGNLLISEGNYNWFENWMEPICNEMLREQNQEGVNWTPSKLVWRLGKEIDNPESVFYWCYKNQIPVFSPAITDGAIGDVLFDHAMKHPGLRLDIVEDIKLMNMQPLYAAHSGIIILGGGLVKHHICNANLHRNGADYSVFINTAQEFDGSDSGASPDEAVSWGKIKMEARPVKICADHTLVFPLLVAETFAKEYFGDKKINGDGEMNGGSKMIVDSKS